MATDASIASDISTASSMWREETEEPELVELRQHRDMLSKDHKRLMREYAFVMQHDEEDR